jgi:antitoxin (DNA-binding transcriptional repressor) of toxin-antitoxin stability system
MMERYSLKDAQKLLQELIDEAQHGKVILIEDENERIVQLVPLPQYGPRKAGSARGQIKMAADFDAPIADFDEYME